MSHSAAMTTEPEAIDVGGGEVVITWEEGDVSRFAAADLRAVCPCAECRGLREQGRFHPSPDVTAVGAELVGNWGLSITWSDGHSTGIYSWEMLRA